MFHSGLATDVGDEHYHSLPSCSPADCHLGTCGSVTEPHNTVDICFTLSLSLIGIQCIVLPLLKETVFNYVT